MTPNARRKDGVTALMNAAIEGHSDIVQVLLNRDADVNMKDDGGWTALMRAAQGGPTTIKEDHNAIVRLLLAKGADVNVRSTNGMTALHLAEYHGHTEIVQLLKKAGAWR